jgi:hypothetical protein
MEEFTMARRSKREYLRSIYPARTTGGEEDDIRGVLQDLWLQPQICHLVIKPYSESGMR